MKVKILLSVKKHAVTSKKCLPWKEMISDYTRNIDMQHTPLKYSTDHILHISDFDSNIICFIGVISLYGSLFTESSRVISVS